MNQDDYFFPIILGIFLLKDRIDCLSEDFYTTFSYTKQSEHKYSEMFWYY